MRLRIYRPAASGTEPLPVIMWIHGGGWVLSDTDTYDASCRGLCNKTGAIVVSPDYRRAPEAVFPASHDDVLAAYRWTTIPSRYRGRPPPRSRGGSTAAAAAPGARGRLLQGKSASRRSASARSTLSSGPSWDQNRIGAWTW